VAGLILAVCVGLFSFYVLIVSFRLSIHIKRGDNCGNCKHNNNNDVAGINFCRKKNKIVKGYDFCINWRGRK